MPTAQLEALVQHLRTTTAPGPLGALSDGQLLARFAASRDEAAFSVLVQRHGPMVLAVCRRQLRDWHAAQDAFQATFLVLARKAGALAQPELLARWLHGVACRTAARARVDAARRREREGQAQARQIDEPNEDLMWRELRPVLDEEIARLPARQAAAVVLCYLEERTNAEAARRLGCSRGTVATLLARARARLRRRLASRGLSLPAGLLGAAGVPVALTGSTVKAAAVFAAGEISAAGPLSASAAALAEGVLQTMMVNKLKLVAAAVLLLGLVGAGLARFRADAGESPAARGESEARPAAPQAQVTPSVVRHTAPAPYTRTSYRTPNFIVTAPTHATAEKIGQAAEQARKAQALLWLGEDLPDWDEPCPIRVTLASEQASGATTFQFAADRVPRMEMILSGPLDRILECTLPHEVTHAVLACKLRRGLPRWADEGAAIMAESPASRKRSESALRDVVKANRLIPLRRLLAMHDYPQRSEDIMAMFAQGYSLVDFLVKRRSHHVFVLFVAYGEKSGWDKALRQHYGYRKIEELESDWLAQVRKDLKTPPAMDQLVTQRPLQGIPYVERLFDEHAEQKPSGPTRAWPRPRLPTGPAPVQVLAAVDPDGRLVIRRERPTYVKPQTVRTENGQLVTSYTAVTTMVEQRYYLKWVRVYDVRGKEIPREQVSRWLKDEALVLASVNGRPVDPLHLRLLKEDTLVVVLPVPQDPVPSVPAQAADTSGPYQAPAVAQPPLAYPPAQPSPATYSPPQVVPAPGLPVSPPTGVPTDPVQPPAPVLNP